MTLVDYEVVCPVCGNRMGRKDAIYDIYPALTGVTIADTGRKRIFVSYDALKRLEGLYGYFGRNYIEAKIVYGLINTDLNTISYIPSDDKPEWHKEETEWDEIGKENFWRNKERANQVLSKDGLAGYVKWSKRRKTYVFPSRIILDDVNGYIATIYEYQNDPVNSEILGSLVIKPILSNNFIYCPSLVCQHKVHALRNAFIYPQKVIDLVGYTYTGKTHMMAAIQDDFTNILRKYPDVVEFREIILQADAVERELDEIKLREMYNSCIGLGKTINLPPFEKMAQELLTLSFLIKTKAGKGLILTYIDIPGEVLGERRLGDRIVIDAINPTEINRNNPAVKEADLILYCIDADHFELSESRTNPVDPLTPRVVSNPGDLLREMHSNLGTYAPPTAFIVTKCDELICSDDRNYPFCFSCILNRFKNVMNIGVQLRCSSYRINDSVPREVENWFNSKGKDFIHWAAQFIISKKMETTSGNTFGEMLNAMYNESHFDITPFICSAYGRLPLSESGKSEEMEVYDAPGDGLLVYTSEVARKSGIIERPKPINVDKVNAWILLLTGVISYKTYLINQGISDDFLGQQSSVPFGIAELVGDFKFDYTNISLMERVPQEAYYVKQALFISETN